MTQKQTDEFRRAILAATTRDAAKENYLEAMQIQHDYTGKNMNRHRMHRATEELARMKYKSFF